MNSSNITPTNSQPTGSRQPVDRATLVKLAQDEIIAATNAQETFTAYDITKRLRAKFPMLDIVHTDVRDFAVHPTMGDLIANGLAYEWETRNYPNGPAKTYLPQGSVIQGSVTVSKPAAPTTPALPQVDWD